MAVQRVANPHPLYPPASLDRARCLAGRLLRVDEQILALQPELSAAEALMRKLRVQMEGLAAERATRAEEVEAFNLVLQLQWPEVDVSGLKPVRAWAGKYGARGSFKEFILHQVKLAAPEPITSVTLALRVRQEFGLSPTTARDKKRFQNSVTGVLRIAAAQGLLQQVEKAHRHTSWRWGVTVGLTELLALGSSQRRRVLKKLAPALEYLWVPAGSSRRGVPLVHANRFVSHLARVPRPTLI